MPTKKEKEPLSVTHPELAAQAHGWDPLNVTLGSVQRLEWICSLGHIWIATPNSRTSNSTGCPFCAGQKILEGFNDLLTLNPGIAEEADGWDPKKVFFRSNLRLKWKCKLNHSWTVSPANRYFSKSGCPICAGKKIQTGFNDLKTLFPKIAEEAHEWDPGEISPNSHKKFKWKCHCGYVYLASPNQRMTYIKTSKSIRETAGCPKCAGKILIEGTNDLETLYPDVALEADGWNPKLVFPVSHQVVNWKCDKGHQWQASISNRTSRQSKCPICSGQKLLTGFNDLLTLFPEIGNELVGGDPSKILAGTHKKIKWECKLGHSWIATVDSRTRAGNGCPTCANSGFDPNDDGYLYFIDHPNWGMYQIGITNTPKRRLQDHKRLGWEVLEIRGPMDGHLTQQWETAILRMLKAKGADLSNSEIAGKFNGYSEAWSKSTFEIKSIKELMKLTDEFEEE